MFVVAWYSHFFARGIVDKFVIALNSLSVRSKQKLALLSIHDKMCDEFFVGALNLVGADYFLL